MLCGFNIPALMSANYALDREFKADTGTLESNSKLLCG